MKVCVNLRRWVRCFSLAPLINNSNLAEAPLSSESNLEEVPMSSKSNLTEAPSTKNSDLVKAPLSRDSNQTTEGRVIDGEVLVLGMARQGKSHLGNAIAGFPDEELFPTADGCTSCTSEIKSVQLNGLQLESVQLNASQLDDLRSTPELNEKVTFNIKYTDTPGFPDSDDDVKTVEIFDNIVDYINNKRPDAIVWLINPGNRNPEDKEMYQRYSLLLKEFSRSGIYCTVLVNNQGSKNKYKTTEKKKQGLIGIRGQIKDYGYGIFTPFDPEISLYEDELADTLLTILYKVDSTRTLAKDTGGDNDFLNHKMRTFQDMKDMYLNHFDDAKKTEEFLRSKNTELSALKGELARHENRIEVCNSLLNGADPAGNLVKGIIVAIEITTVIVEVVTFDIWRFTSLMVHGSKEMAKKGLECLIDESTEKIRHLQKKILELKTEIANQDPDEVKKHAKQSLEEYVAILKALRLEDDVQKIKGEHPEVF